MLIPDYQAHFILLAKPSADIDKLYDTHFEQTFKAILKAANKACSFIPINAPDIWLRDFTPLQLTGNRFLSFQYLPDYQPHSHSKHVQKSILPYFENVKKIPLVLDGGHITFNAKGTVIISEKVLFLNNISSEKLRMILQEQAGFKKVVVLPCDKYEKTGHIDGFLQFLDDTTLVINDDSDKDKSTKAHYNTCCTLLQNQCPELKLVPIPCVYDNRTYCGWQSAIGIHTNFLATKNALFLPIYGIQTDKEAQETLARHYQKPIIPIRMEKIAKWGGSLHCITATATQQAFVKNN